MLIIRLNVIRKLCVCVCVCVSVCVSVSVCGVQVVRGVGFIFYVEMVSSV